MTEESLWAIFVDASLTNNFVLAYFLGICPFLGVTGRMDTATRMGGAVIVVMLVTSICVYGIQWLLVAIGAPCLRLVSFVVVIASLVQLVEMFVKKMSPWLFRALGMFLPVITTNCAILGLALFQTNRGYGFVQGVVYALGAGVGFTMALILMAGLRERLELVTVPDMVNGTALTLVLAGIPSLAFMGFAGLGT